MTDLGLRTGKQNNRHLIIPPKKETSGSSECLFFYFVVSARSLPFTGQGFRQKHLLRVTLD